MAIRKAEKSTKKTVKIKEKGDGYKEHRPGSRKGKAHELFDKLGRDALPKVVALGIKAQYRAWVVYYIRRKEGEDLIMPDFRIELSHFPDRTLAWEWVTYDPQNVETTLHLGGAHYDSPDAALQAAKQYMQNRAAQRFIR